MNKKEEVISLELTQYGKLMLSKGKLKPMYYAFSDDNILYDGRYGGVEEEVREVQERIQTTPQRKTQYCFTSLEKQVKQLTELIRSGKAKYTDDMVQNYEEREYSLKYILGTSQYANDKYPAYTVKALLGEIDDSSSNISEAHQVVKIPQINFKPVTYRTQVFDGTNPSEVSGEQSAGTGGSRVGDQLFAGTTNNHNLNAVSFSDGSYIEVFEEKLLLDILEHNTEYLFENFDMEVFIVEDVDEQGKTLTAQQAQNTDTKEKLTPLSFVKRRSNIVNGILMDKEDLEFEETDPQLDPSFVEYWFNIFTDEQVDRTLVCYSRPDKYFTGNVFVQDAYSCSDDVRLNNRLTEAQDDFISRRERETQETSFVSSSGRRPGRPVSNLFGQNSCDEEGE